jgi:tetratricopeptide (TPR) repeat protein
MPRVLPILLLSAVALAQQPAQTKPQQPGPNAPAPRSDQGSRASSSADPNSSSSRDTLIDLSPPPDEKPSAPPDEVGELHPYDPHRAAKNLEVGEYYYSQKNYPAALSRFQEALEWKSNDAVTTYRLAQTYEKLGQNDEAVKNYTAYLGILPRGEFAEDARKSLARLGAPVPPVPPRGEKEAAQAQQQKDSDADKKGLGKRIKEQFGSDWCVSAPAAQGCTKKPPIKN